MDVHVKRLREALGEAAAMVETVRGAGYRLTAQAGRCSQPGAAEITRACSRPGAIVHASCGSFPFCCCQCLGAVVGVWLAPEALQIRGGLGRHAGGLLWVLLDFARGLRLLHWLRQRRRVRTCRSGWACGARWPTACAAWCATASDETRRERAPPAGLPGRHPGFAQRRGAAGCARAASNGATRRRPTTSGSTPQRDLLQHIGNLVRDPGFAAYCRGRRLSQRSVTMPGRGTARRRARSRCRCTCTPMARAARLLLSRDVTAVEQAEAMRRDFVANVSHEIRTPLTVLAGFVETLQTPAAGRDRARALPGPDGAAGRAHADAGERPADAVATGGQPAARGW